jgi:hypothetical protein
MKKILRICPVIILTACLLSCNENRYKGSNSTGSRQDTSITKPPETNLSPQQIQEQINKEVSQALSASGDSIQVEAAMVIAETHNAIQYLVDSNYESATKAIERAIGKAEVITTANPDIGLMPVERHVVVRDLLTDMETLKKARDDVEDLTDEGYLQDARKLIEVMVSEININTVDLPLQTYPDALKAAVVLTRERKPADAALLLNTALNTMVVEERVIPLPLVRAELMLAVADSLIAKNGNEEDIDLLLDNADYQIRFAEELGYGKRDEEFKELYDDIKRLKKEVKDKGSDRQNIVTRLRSRLTAFKNRVSPETKQ